MNGIKSENLYLSCYIEYSILDVVYQEKPLGQLPQQLFSFHCKRKYMVLKHSSCFLMYHFLRVFLKMRLK